MSTRILQQQCAHLDYLAQLMITYILTIVATFTRAKFELSIIVITGNEN